MAAMAGVTIALLVLMTAGIIGAGNFPVSNWMFQIRCRSCGCADTANHKHQGERVGAGIMQMTDAHAG
jgi:hypothetical protein